jgi:CIC family chloride channel protein
MAGGAFGEAVHGAFPSVTASSGAYALVGMAAVFAASARAPITSIIILFEMTRDYHIILPLMMAVVIATVLAQLVSRETIYTIKLMRRGVDVQKEEQDYLMQHVTVADAMTAEPVTVPADMTLPSLAEMFAKEGMHGAPVVDDEGKLVGVITQGDIQRRLESAKSDLRARDIASRQVDTVYPDQTLHRIVARPDAWERHQFPVVDREDPSRLVGVLSRSDIVRAYSRLTAQREEAEQHERTKTISRGPDTRLMTFRIGSRSPLVGRELRTVSLPTDSVIVSIYRRGRTVIPRGDTVVRAGDQMAVLAQSTAEEKVKQVLTPPPGGKKTGRASPPSEDGAGHTPSG